MAEDLFTLVEQVCERFQSDTSGVSIKILHMDGKRFVGINASHREAIDVREIRDIILEPFAGGPNQRIVQVVGDSGTAVSNDKLIYAQELLAGFIDDDTIIEYGFTCLQHDANWLVENLTVTQPGLALRLVGNVVQASIESIRSGWSGLASIQHLVLVYHESERQTSFGADVWVSDGIMSAAARDMMICFEGGLQALKQCVNALVAGIRVIAVTNIRQKETSGRFSAARFLAHLQRQSIINAQNYLEDYLQLPPKQRDSIWSAVAELMGQGQLLTNLTIEEPPV